MDRLVHRALDHGAVRQEEVIEDIIVSTRGLDAKPQGDVRFRVPAGIPEPYGADHTDVAQSRCAHLVAPPVGVEARVRAARKRQRECQAEAVAYTVAYADVQRVDVEQQGLPEGCSALPQGSADVPLVGAEVAVRHINLPLVRFEERARCTQTG